MVGVITIYPILQMEKLSLEVNFLLYEDSTLEKELRPRILSKSEVTANPINSEREFATILWRAKNNKLKYPADGEISGPVTGE